VPSSSLPPDPVATPAIRPAQAGDDAAIHRLLIAAFGGTAEAALIERLREAGDVLCALVSTAGDAPIGFILFCPLRLAGAAGSVTLAGLAPLAVAPPCQGRGIGTALVRAGLAACEARGVEAAVVLGDARYYGRFGFRAELAAGLTCAWSGPHLQAVALRDGALAGVEGRLIYPAAFAAL